jgi:hypothetical protein
VASTDARLLALGRAHFDALLGPLRELLAQQAAGYAAASAAVAQRKVTKVRGLGFVIRV